MNELLIKKYPNRRLYDTGRGVYVTLNDLRQLVQGERSIKIIDANTEVDITRAILLQVLSEEEHDSAFLMQITCVASCACMAAKTLRVFSQF